MRYIEFRDSIEAELRKQSKGLTWKQLKARLELPYERPCPTWTKQLENEIGLSRARGSGRAYVWKIHQ